MDIKWKLEIQRDLIEHELGSVIRLGDKLTGEKQSLGWHVFAKVSDMPPARISLQNVFAFILRMN